MSRSARQVLTTVGLVRIGIGAAFALAPDRLALGRPSSAFMTQSFAVREALLGAGALMAGRTGDDASVRQWAALGTACDVGDLTVALLDVRRGAVTSWGAAALAAYALVTEARALRVSPSGR